LSHGDETQVVLIAVRHVTRRRILRAMIDQPEDAPLSARGLSDRFAMPLSNVNYHVQFLRRCGAIRLAGTRKVRGSIEHFYEPTDLADHPVARAALAAEPD
jgi:DNA-binding transcriptional ArsR family regulator